MPMDAIGTGSGRWPVLIDAVLLLVKRIILRDSGGGSWIRLLLIRSE
jgi:hypothetical protein